MPLLNKIDQDLTQAMRDQQADKVAVLRMVKAAITNEQIKLGHDLSEDEVTTVVKREAKQRRDSIEQYQQGGRDDLAEKESSELEIIKGYLPEQLSEADLKVLVDQVVTDTGASSLAEMGVVIGAVIKQVSGRADGSEVSRLVKERLTQ